MPYWHCIILKTVLKQCVWKWNTLTISSTSMEVLSHISAARYIFLARIYSKPTAAAGGRAQGHWLLLPLHCWWTVSGGSCIEALNCEAFLTAHDPHSATFDALGTDLTLVSKEEVLFPLPKSELSTSQAAVAQGAHDKDRTAEPAGSSLPFCLFTTHPPAPLRWGPCALREDDPAGDRQTHHCTGNNIISIMCSRIRTPWCMTPIGKGWIVPCR